MQNLTKKNNHINHQVAVYHTGALGDLLVSTAALYESIQFFSNSEFTIIGSPLWKELLIPKIWPSIKLILTIENKNFKHFKLWKPNAQNLGWEETPITHPNIISFLKDYDATIDFRTESIRFAWRALLAKVPMRIGRSQSKFTKLFFTHFTQEKNNKNIHERDRYLEILLSLEENRIREKIAYWKENGLPDLIKKTPLLSEKKILLINPTASIREKAWPSEKFRQLAIKLKEQNNEVIIIGSPKETSWLKEVSSEDFKMLQPQNIQELIKIVSQAKLVITNTSSMQFIAASTKTSTLTLMGLAEAEKWGPLGSWSSYIKGKESQLNSGIFKPKKVSNKLNEVLSYNSISVNDVLAKIVL